MPLTGVTFRENEEILAVVADRSHVQLLTSNWLDRNYYSLDASLHRFVRPGLILAQNTATKKYVPYNASALYGPGSDTAVGILDVPVEATLEDPAIAPVYHAKIIEAHAYVWGGNLGTVPTAVKTALTMIKWV